jgi:hypothetical protein
MAAYKFAIANLMAIELQRLQSAQAAPCAREAASGPCRGHRDAKVEGVKDQAHAARAITRGLCLGEVRKPSSPTPHYSASR